MFLLARKEGGKNEEIQKKRGKSMKVKCEFSTPVPPPARRINPAENLVIFNHWSRSGVPNLSLTTYPFSIPTNEYVPLQHFDRRTYTPTISYGKIFLSWLFTDIFNNKYIMTFANNIRCCMYKYLEVNNMEIHFSLLSPTSNIPLQIGKCTLGVHVPQVGNPWSRCSNINGCCLFHYIIHNKYNVVPLVSSNTNRYWSKLDDGQTVCVFQDGRSKTKYLYCIRIQHVNVNFH